VFSPALTQLSLTELLESCIPKVQPISKPEVKVWVSQRSDVYYCPGSKGYGTRAPGEYMTESEAIHKGFRGRAKVLCGEASPTTDVLQRLEEGQGSASNGGKGMRLQGVRPNTRSINRFCVRTSPFLTHRTCPFRILCIAS